MELRGLTTVVIWLNLGVIFGSMKLHMAGEERSTVRGQNIVKRSSPSHQRQSNIRTHFKQRSTSEVRNLTTIYKKKNVLRLSIGKRRSLSRRLIATKKLRHGFLEQISKKTETSAYPGRRNIAYYKTPSFPSHLDFKLARRDEDGLLKRSRNRVRLKNQGTPARIMESSKKWFPKKYNITLDTKEPEKINASSEMKRQRISDGFMFADRLNELPSDGVQLNENPDSFFANPLATKPEQRILHSSHFFSPAVHKFLPAEHRFSGEPIHRYLSSPVLFKDANTEGLSRFVARGDPGSNGLFEGPPMPPLFQGPPYHGNRVIIFNRPIHTPVPVPVHGPPRIAVIHHPVPLPPQQIPVPVPIPGPRPPQYIVIHRDFSGPAIDPCGVNPCRNGGTCTAVVTDFKCICPVGYKGERCEVQSRCLPNPCKNFGKCTELPEDFECTCHTGFHGKACDLESKCEPNPCRNGGVCTENIENYICSCAAGFMGKNCERESKCLPINPCKNSGVCTEDLSGYKCNCKDGFDGVNCEVRQTSTACDSTPCLNGGTCITDIYDFSKFSCYCGSGFTGLSCEGMNHRSGT
ncbi:Neurogenic locus notch-like protein 1 [Stylophora pistillata]|uniref:Neurogenic locus notch-like protein 1 n=1 Tax=Stylophora pistillata TaxID=50429 RepID=A0A2B4RSA7_STYPI|nr:Neurogenic locus notch-like protein 1 [Stylophora pistillata]